MRQVSLRDFRTRGNKAIADVPAGETVLLSGHQGPVWFLVPVFGDIAAEERELRRAMAKAALRASWAKAEAAGITPLDDAAIRKEVIAARRSRRRPA